MAINWLKPLPQKNVSFIWPILIGKDKYICGTLFMTWQVFRRFNKLVLSKSCYRREEQDIWKAILVARDLPVYLSKDIYLEQDSQTQCARQFGHMQSIPFSFSIKPSTSHGTIDHLRGWTHLFEHAMCITMTFSRLRRCIIFAGSQPLLPTPKSCLQ